MKTYKGKGMIYISWTMCMYVWYITVSIFRFYKHLLMWWLMSDISLSMLGINFCFLLIVKVLCLNYDQRCDTLVWLGSLIVKDLSSISIRYCRIQWLQGKNQLTLLEPWLLWILLCVFSIHSNFPCQLVIILSLIHCVS